MDWEPKSSFGRAMEQAARRNAREDARRARADGDRGVAVLSLVIRLRHSAQVEHKAERSVVADSFARGRMRDDLA